MDCNRIINGDAFDALADVDENCAHAAVVDYPWDFQIQTGAGESEFRNAPRGASSGCRDRDSDEVMFDMADDEGFSQVLDQLSRTLVDGSWLICMADDRFQTVIREAIENHSDWTFRRNWAWTPNHPGMGYYGRVDHYPIPTATLGETDRYVRDRGTLYSVKNGRSVDYPTGKPVSLYRQLLEPPVIEEGEMLLEPFCGSGPGAAVAAERGLDYWGCDVDVEAVRLTGSHFNQNRLNSYAVADGGFNE